jgi:hypothetical protein
LTFPLEIACNRIKERLGIFEGAREMKVGVHAVRRYKSRIGCRTSSRKRIVSIIKKEIEKNTQRRIYNHETGQYRIETPKFVAVCEKGMVVTILPPAS